MNKKILVVDDEEIIRKMMSRILVSEGYEVLLVNNGVEALAVIERPDLDLVILDMNMPELNGLEFLRKIRSSNLTDIPVLMMSGSTDERERAECYKLGVYDFITKPEQIEVMLKRVENGIKIGEMVKYHRFIRGELLMAKKLQRYLYPEPLLSLPGVDIRAWSLPFSDVGGDLYDYIQFQDGRIIFFIADVSGHGIGAALFTTIVKMVFRNAIKVSNDPGDIMTFMNRELTENLPVESFVTMFCGLVDIARGTMTYVNAGHPAPYCVTGDNLYELSSAGSFLGPIEGSRFESVVENIDPGKSFFFFTDGVVDVADSEGSFVGKKMLLDAMKAGPLTANERFDLVVANLLGKEVRRIDDCTLLLVHFK